MKLAFASFFLASISNICKPSLTFQRYEFWSLHPSHRGILKTFKILLNRNRSLNNPNLKIITQVQFTMSKKEVSKSTITEEINLKILQVVSTKRGITIKRLAILYRSEILSFNYSLITDLICACECLPIRDTKMHSVFRCGC